MEPIKERKQTGKDVITQSPTEGDFGLASWGSSEEPHASELSWIV